MDKYFLCIQIWLIIVFVDTQSTQRFEGDLCLHRRLHKAAKCKLISDCPWALQEVKHNILPETCGFNGRTPIVCCVESTPLPVAASTTPTIITRTTTRSSTSRLSTTNPTIIKGPSFTNSRSQFDIYFGPPDGNVGKKSYEKCREFGKYVNVSYVLPGFHKVRYRDTCGFKASRLIVGGTSAKTQEFPHMAAIGYNAGDSTEYLCGGSLISERFVITAAHCLNNLDYGPPKFVRLGDLNLKSDLEDAAPEDFNIVEAIKHPLYDPSQSYNDIALLKLDREVTFNAYVRPICLPVHRTPPSELGVATGWGTVDALHTQSDHLLKITLELLNFEECNAKLQSLRNGVLDDMQLCAGLRMNRRDACQGDSGGPLQIYHENPDAYCMYMLIGVTSLAKSCGTQNTPGVYTRVQHYLNWIETTVWS